jgi:3-oxoacyl-[acyl-carrier-protein] synthase II
MIQADSLSSRSIQVKGIGGICAAGKTIEEIWGAIEKRQSCFSIRAGFPMPLGWVDEKWISHPPVPLKNWIDAPRIAKISVLAAYEAYRCSRSQSPVDHFYFGTARGWSMDEKAPWPQKLLWMPWTSVPGFIAGAIGGSRQILGVQAACASGAVAIIHAAQSLLTQGGQTAIAGGADAPLSISQLNPMREMKMLSVDHGDGGGCVPFHINPRGITPAEGAAFLALENKIGEWESGEIELAGWAWRSDARSRWGENSGEIETLLDQAVEMAGCSYHDIQAVWTHGSGTAANDNGEWLALETWSKKRCHQPLILLTSKGVTGHAFAATSALEAGLACMALKRGVLPPAMVLPDQMRASESLRLLSAPTRLISPWLVTLSMGFWGEIAVLIFRKHGI